jgi:hypothetical protein
MTLTSQERKNLDLCELLRRYETEAVDEAFETVAAVLETHGVVPAMDDRAAALKAALVRYVFESRETGRPMSEVWR